jgi:hypothetical protein
MDEAVREGLAETFTGAVVGISGKLRQNNPMLHGFITGCLWA